MITLKSFKDNAKIIEKTDEERLKISHRGYTPTGYNKQLKRLLHAQGITYVDLAKALNAGYSTLRCWLNQPECAGKLDVILYVSGLTLDDLERFGNPKVLEKVEAYEV